MIKRDIINYLDEKVGEIEFPDETPEAVIEAKLAKYALPPPTPVFEDVTPRQMRQALILSGVTMQQIEDALDALPESTKSLAKVEWEYSLAFQRNRPLVAQVAQLLGWTSEQLDNLWAFAKTL